MDAILNHIKTKIYDPCGLHLTHLESDPESQAYKACRFNLNNVHILSRNAKITPKKAGQFVTFYKRNQDKQIVPFNADDLFDFYVVNVQKDKCLGQFVFSKATLIDKGILSTVHKEGKRAFRVYPDWDVVSSKQAQRTQHWQLDYFYNVTNSTDLKKVKALYTGSEIS